MRCPTGEAVGGGKRGGNSLVQSRGSRQRQEERLVNYPGQLVWFVVLTLPREHTQDGRLLEEKLEAWWRWFKRGYPRWDMCWKKEFQHRGAWHVHLLFGSTLEGRWEPEDMWIDWKAGREKWWQLIGSGDRHHRKRGLHAERIRSAKAARWYQIKYLAKDSEQVRVPDGWTGVGRWWGSCRDWRAKARSTEVEYELTPERVVDYVRYMRRLLGGTKADIRAPVTTSALPLREDAIARRRRRWLWANGRLRAEHRERPWILDGRHGCFCVGHAGAAHRVMEAMEVPRIRQVE